MKYDTGARQYLKFAWRNGVSKNIIDNFIAATKDNVVGILRNCCFFYCVIESLAIVLAFIKVLAEGRIIITTTVLAT